LARKKTQNASESTGPNWIVLLVGIGLVLLGGSTFMDGFESFRMTMLDMPGWEEVDARITKSEVYSKDQWSGSQQTTYYRPRVEFSYTYDGKSYTGTRLQWFEEPDTRLAKIEDVLKRFPEGERTKAYVNPEDPSQAVLDREATGDATTYVAIGSLFSVIGLVLLGFFVWTAWSMRSRDASSRAG